MKDILGITAKDIELYLELKNSGKCKMDSPIDIWRKSYGRIEWYKCSTIELNLEWMAEELGVDL